MEGLRPPDQLNLSSGNVSESWKRFKQSFELYVDATAHINRTDKQLIGLFLHCAGHEAIEVSNTFHFENAADRTYENLMQKFEQYCIPKVNETHERYVFRSRILLEGESIEKFVTDLRIKAQTCNYGQLRDSLIRDQIVFGITNRKLKDRLLREDNLDLNKAIQICQSAELVEKQLKSWDQETLRPKAVENPGTDVLMVGAAKFKEKARDPRTPAFRCKFCDFQHRRGSCPAYGKKCAICSKLNHFASVCWASEKGSNKSRVHMVEETSQDYDFFVNMVVLQQNTEVTMPGKDWMIPIMIGGSVINFKMDTGAQVNILPNDLFKQLKNRPVMEKSLVQLYGYGGSRIEVVGQARVTLQAKDKLVKSLVIVVKDGKTPILGLESCNGLGLIKRIAEVKEFTGHNYQEKELREEVLQRFPELFRGLGCIMEPHTIRLKEGSIPVVQAPRRIPMALKDRLKEELDVMVEAGVIRRIEEPTEWVSSLVLVEKKGTQKLRVCLDPKNLNNCIKREHFQIPTKEELEAEMAGVKYFSQLDANSGFYQIPLDETSSKLCTFNTPFGRYCFLRMPFGIASAPELFHRSFSQIFESSPGVVVYLDNILVWGNSREEHRSHLMEALKKASRAGITLNLQKCEFEREAMEFLGDHLSPEGIQPGPDKIKAITEMPQPKTKEELQRVLGMVTYLGKFLPNLSSNTSELRNLLHEDKDFVWTSIHDEEWSKVKSKLTKKPILKYFQGNLDTMISVDASKTGLGAVLLQKHGLEWQPVAYASRTLTLAESRYAQIEKEALGLVFGCERFHTFVYGKQFFMETDHRPLVTIHRKTLSEMPPRLQRLFLRLSSYQFELAFTPGRKLIVADTLSRSPLPEAGKHSINDEVKIHVNLITTSLPISDRMWNNLVKETKEDSELQAVICGLQSDQNLPAPYGSFIEELSVANGVLLKRDRIVVPANLRNEFLSIVHEGHLGIEKCRRRARQLLYWPNMNLEVEKK